MNRRDGDQVYLRQLLTRGVLLICALAILDQVGRIEVQSAEIVAAITTERDRMAEDRRFLNPICPDQWIAQRGANEPWQVKCVTASSNGSRAR